MIVVRFRDEEDSKELLHKVKKMREYAEMLEECLENAMDEEPEYRGTSYRRHYDDEDMRMEGRYGYRK